MRDSYSRFRLAPLSPTIIQDSIEGKSYVFHSMNEANQILKIFQQYERIHKSSVRKIAELERRIQDLQMKLETYIRIENELDICQRQVDMLREELEEYEDA